MFVRHPSPWNSDFLNNWKENGPGALTALRAGREVTGEILRGIGWRRGYKTVLSSSDVTGQIRGIGGKTARHASYFDAVSMNATFFAGAMLPAIPGPLGISPQYS